MSISNQNQSIVFGGGCFWCMEAVFQMLRGVASVTSGYTGGARANPTYEQVSSSATGHVEVIEVRFDPSIVGLNELLSVFFTSHDPTTLDRQGNDVGPQYRSAIFYTQPEQKEVIEKYIAELIANATFKDPIVTQVKPLTTFYKAEGYHQNYYQTNKSQPYCQFVIDPKITKVRQKYAHLLKTDS